MKKYVLTIVLLFLVLLLTACGGSGGSGQSDTEPVMKTGSITRDSSGAELEILPESGSTDILVRFVSVIPPEDFSDNGVNVSDEFNIELDNFNRGDSIKPFVVNIPIALPSEIEDVGRDDFFIEVYNTETGVWELTDIETFYNADTGILEFLPNHFTKYRAIYMGTDKNTNLNVMVYYGGRFKITYFKPTVFGQVSPFFPKDNGEWIGSGLASDVEVPDYIEDLASALEDALTYHTTMIKDSSGTNLFTDPTFDAPSLPGGVIEVTVTKLASKVETRLGGPVRIDSQLDDYSEMQSVASHELIHYLSDQHYTGVGARYNRWFYEAMAEYYTTKTVSMPRDDQLVYYSQRFSNYLRVSLDASDEDSYYAAGDFLYWLEKEMSISVVADVVRLDSASDLTGINSVLTDHSWGLSDAFKEYVLDSTVGGHDFNASQILNRKVFTNDSLDWRVSFQKRHLSAKYLSLSSSVAKDGLLVAESEKTYHIHSDNENLSVSTYSYDTQDLVVSDYADRLELDTDKRKPILVEHFGKKDTPDVTAPYFRQVIMNKKSFDILEDAEYVFDYYVLVPPEITEIDNNTVTWTYPNSAYQHTGTFSFNVYLNGEKINSSSVYGSQYSDSRIVAGTLVEVTVVDSYGNEWPEVEPVVSSGDKWEFQILVAADLSDTISKDTTIIDFGVYVPIEIGSDGSFSFSHSFTESVYADESYCPPADVVISGDGTYDGTNLSVTGQWTTAFLCGKNPGPYSHDDTGTFSAKGKFIAGFFFGTASESFGTADSIDVFYSNLDDPNNTTYGNGQTPEITLWEMRPVASP